MNQSSEKNTVADSLETDEASVMAKPVFVWEQMRKLFTGINYSER